MIIAVDGTTASGKGTISRRLAAWFGVPAMDTGRLYRATGVAALKAGLALDDASAVADIARTLDLNDFEEDELRAAGAGQAASQVAVIPEVRQALFELQRAFATQSGGALLDGRDIGTVIAPDADAKLWIDASVEVRAGRRMAEFIAAGRSITLDQMIAELKERDTRDAARTDAPSQMAQDAVLIDTSDLTIDAAVERAVAAVETAIANR
jgi:cytidylate kinase